MPHLDPLRYAGKKVGPIGSIPLAAGLPERFLYFATDTRAIWAVWDGAWLKIADLTAGVAWDEIVNKPATFAPAEHDLATAHSGSLPISRVIGHDTSDETHIRVAAVALVLGRF
jgi:hypothetical protein